MALAQTQIDNPRQTSIFRNILVAVDLSPASQRAVAEALAVAQVNRADISVVHVLQADWRYEMLENPPELDLERIDAHQRLKKWIGETGLEQKINFILVKHGPVARAIVSVAADSGADLVVAGTHGRGGFSKFALGSVAEELLRIAPCPVMTIGPKAEKREQISGFHTILFATDFRPASLKALPLVVELTQTYRSKLILVHMIAPMPATTVSLSAYAPATAGADELQEWEVSCRKRALQELTECLPAGMNLEKEPECVVGIDFLPEGVLSAATKFKADLIVMGATRTAAQLAAHVPWTAVHEVLANARCPVLTVAESEK